MMILLIIAIMGLFYLMYKAYLFDADVRVEMFLKQNDILYTKDYTNKDVKYIKIQSGIYTILLKFNNNGEFIGYSVVQKT